MTSGSLKETDAVKETAHKVSDIYESASIPTINFNKIIQKIERLQKLKREKVVVNNTRFNQNSVC